MCGTDKWRFLTMRHPLFAASTTLLKVAILLNVFSAVKSRTCGEFGFQCVGASQVQQCVEGEPMGPLEECGPGFLCDVRAPWGPCVPQPEDACCEEGLSPVKGNCLLFMSCINDGTKLVRYFGSCAPGYFFSPLLSSCRPLTSANSSFCAQDDENLMSNSTQTTPATTSTSPMITSPTTTTSTTTTTTTPPKTTTTTKPTTITKPVCNSPGHYPDPASCRHYYVCSWAAGGGVKATRVQCARNLFFDSTLRQCVFTTNCGTRPR